LFINKVLAYTRVLQGAINFASAVFPEGISPNVLDIEARLPLWTAGLDFGHGTGHGIDFFLAVHAAPTPIAYNSQSADVLQSGMTLAVEPGYYQKDGFGVRLETDIEVVEQASLFKSGPRKTLRFEPLSLVPFEEKLVEVCLLTKKQIKYLNDYNALIRSRVLPLLAKYPEVQEFLVAKTKPVDMVDKSQMCQSDSIKREQLMELTDFFEKTTIPSVLFGVALIVFTICPIFIVIAVSRMYASKSKNKYELNHETISK
jgi:hypothetical protein